MNTVTPGSHLYDGTAVTLDRFRASLQVSACDTRSMRIAAPDTPVEGSTQHPCQMQAETFPITVAPDPPDFGAPHTVNQKHVEEAPPLHSSILTRGLETGGIPGEGGNRTCASAAKRKEQNQKREENRKKARLSSFPAAPQPAPQPHIVSPPMSADENRKAKNQRRELLRKERKKKVEAGRGANESESIIVMGNETRRDDGEIIGHHVMSQGRCDSSGVHAAVQLSVPVVRRRITRKSSEAVLGSCIQREESRPC